MSEKKNIITSFLVVGFVYLFYANWGWGIYRSFSRHGPVHGIAAVFIPPYAWYRGVAATWETPLWREKYSDEVNNIARIALIQRPKEAEGIVGLTKVMTERRKFVESLPTKEAEELKAAFAALADAYTALQVRNTCVVFGHTNVMAQADQCLSDAEAKMSKTPQLISVWEEYKENEKHSIQQLYAKIDVDQIAGNREQLFTVTQSISIGTENAWGQLRKSCREMKLFKETDAQSYDRTLWDALFDEVKILGASPEAFDQDHCHALLHSHFRLGQ